jgi:small subunit ribosomal protein S20
MPAMPHTRNAKKRLRQNLKRRLRNRSVKHAIKTQIKKALAAYKASNLDLLRREISLAFEEAGSRCLQTHRSPQLRRP